MAVEIHSMTKEIHKRKNRDEVLWENFVLKTNIKKKDLMVVASSLTLKKIKNPLQEHQILIQLMQKEVVNLF